MSGYPQPDGPCGCVGVHVGQSHAAHMDALDRRHNAALLEAAVERGGPGKPFAENALAWLLLGRLAEVEQVRLAAKRVWLAREGTR